jgi:hypothetical protein
MRKWLRSYIPFPLRRTASLLRQVAPSTQLLTEAARGGKSWDKVINRGGVAGGPVGADFAHARAPPQEGLRLFWVQDPRALHRQAARRTRPAPRGPICL